MKQFFRWIILLFLLSTLPGCFSWIRAYQTYIQMEEFDRNFAISVSDEFSVHFKQPKLLSTDFTSLTKLQPSQVKKLDSGKIWRYQFVKMDKHGEILQPEVKFYFDLKFNLEDKLIQWTFSPLFLQIAPAEFLEISFRSLGVAKINMQKKQLRANTDLIEKIATELPKKANVLSSLGTPIKIKQKETGEKYYYHFLLQTNEIERGYEDRVLTVIKLTFNKTSDELIKMAGRFAGLKISIDYRKYRDTTGKQLAQAMEIEV